MLTVTARALSCAAIAASLALTGTALIPANAAPRGGAYVASLTAPLTEPREDIVDGLLWKCAGDRCSAPAKGSRPVVVCGRVAKKFGTVASFTSPQGELSTEELARCNGGA
jgi:hypothetical protein